MRSWYHLLAVAVCIFSLFAREIGAQHRVLANESFYWDINTQKGIIRGQNLKLRKLNHPTNPHHTCYEVTCEGKQCIGKKDGTVTIQVCYPALVITGLPKCGTSAMYDLLSKFPGAITMQEKENCPSTRRRPHWIYFQSLPRMSAVKEHSIVIDGCISIINNMKIRELIQYPDTFYIVSCLILHCFTCCIIVLFYLLTRTVWLTISLCVLCTVIQVMVRDFTDMLWSSYNFWCKREYDGVNCDYSKWADPALHHRSPEIFHELIQLDANHTAEVVQPFYYPMEKPCVNAGGYYSEYLSLHLNSRKLQNRTIIIASEELDAFPQLVAKRVASIINYDITGIDLSTFKDVRVNTQEAKGTNTGIPIGKYTPGRYNISQYRPLLAESRTLLNKCWKEDCRNLATIPPYYKYTACFPELSSTVGDVEVDDMWNLQSETAKAAAIKASTAGGEDVAETDGVRYRHAEGLLIPVLP